MYVVTCMNDNSFISRQFHLMAFLFLVFQASSIDSFANEGVPGQVFPS